MTSDDMTEADEPQPYVIPETWTPEHVAKRLIEAFAIDRRLPRIERPKAPGSAHPQMTYTAEEMEEWEAIPIDPKRFAPQRDEIAVMERAFDWLRILSASHDNHRQAVKIWAMAKAGGRSAKGFCNRSGIAWATFCSRRASGLSIITSGLNMLNEPVW
jgi:Domain of unknown function (DUF6362)